jgi:hypothetical protein
MFFCLDAKEPNGTSRYCGEIKTYNNLLQKLRFQKFAARYYVPMLILSSNLTLSISELYRLLMPIALFENLF